MICQYPFKGKYKETTPYGKAGSWACGWHTGIDLVGLESKDIYPIAAGEVIRVVKGDKSYGNYIRIQHDGYISHYAHLSSILVFAGDKVALNTKIGVEGNTGNSSGSHLHLEVHKNAWKYPIGCTVQTATWLQDPDKFISERLNTVSAWAKEAQAFVIEKGISDGTRPQDNVTREELWVMLQRVGD